MVPTPMRTPQAMVPLCAFALLMNACAASPNSKVEALHTAWPKCYTLNWDRAPVPPLTRRDLPEQLVLDSSLVHNITSPHAPQQRLRRALLLGAEGGPLASPGYWTESDSVYEVRMLGAWSLSASAIEGAVHGRASGSEWGSQPHSVTERLTVTLVDTALFAGHRIACGESDKAAT